MRVLHGPHHRRRRRLRVLIAPIPALVVIAHGSRSTLANDEVRGLAAWLHSHGAADRVEAAFLEQAEPSFEVATDRLVASGAHEVHVFPLFLNSGRHVARDVPALVAAAQAKHPSVTFLTLPHLGGAQGFNAAVLSAIRHGVSARPPGAV